MTAQNPFNQTILSAALEYAERGWHVFPVPPGEKKSHKSAKHSDGRAWGATTDPDEIRRDWATWPGANVGIVTGAPSGFFVIEADTMKGHGVDGIANLSALIEQHGPLPHTIEALSPSGSWHVYFKWPDGAEIGNSAGMVAPGVDVRAEGGMVLGVPSVKPGAAVPYHWKNPPGLFDLADCPDWLLRFCLKQPKKPARVLMIDTGGSSWDFADSGADEVRELLTYIPPDCGYDDWLAVLMALHDKFAGSSAGLAIADHWSAGGASYEAGEVAKKWASFQTGGGVGWATVPALAKQNGADLAAIARRHKGATPGGRRAATSDGTPRPNAESDFDDLSHDALAQDMGAQGWDQDARHVALWGKWLFWDGTRWKRDDKLDHLTRTRAYLRARAETLTEWAEAKVAKNEADEGEGSGNKLRTWAKEQARNLRNNATIAAVHGLARSNAALVASANDFDRDRLLLGTPGGTVDLRTGLLRDARRGDLLTMQTAVAPKPGTPALWLKFLNEVFDGDPVMVAFLQRAAGYALTGETREHKLLFLHGGGRNGKSVFLNTLFGIWGDYARRAHAATFLNSVGDKHPTDLAGLQGARLVIGSELPKGKTWDESVIKDLTGGDTMTARYMRGDFFDFDPQLTLFVAGNNMPSFRGVDEAIRARVVLVPFNVTIPPERRDMNLGDKLKAEAGQILQWAIDGALQWQARGLDVPASVAAASAQYFDDEDTLGQFLADEVSSDPTGFVTTTALHARFVQWCQTQGLNAWTMRTLQKEITGRGWSEARRNHGRGFIGMRLK